MEKTFSIAVKGISINVIIGQLCHRRLQRAGQGKTMDWAIDHAAPHLINYGYADYCGRNGMPTLFTYEEIKEAIDATPEGTPEYKNLQDIGEFYRMVQDEYE